MLAERSLLRNLVRHSVNLHACCGRLHLGRAYAAHPDSWQVDG